MAPPVRFGCQVVAYGDVHATVEQAALAEDCGFDTVTLPDHLFHPPHTEDYLVEPPWEVVTLLGAVAERTESVTLMPGVADTVRRHPTLLAHVTATLDRLSGGRAGLGVGAGEAFNLAPVPDLDWSKPFTRFRESLDVVEALFESTSEDPAAYHGEFFDLEGAYMGLKPVDDPPLYVGGYGPKMRTLTGRRADGWFPWIYTPDAYERDLERVLEAAGDADREGEIDRALMLPSSVSEDGDDALEAARARSKSNLALRPPLLESMGYGDLADAAPYMRDMAFDEAQTDQLDAVVEEIPDDAVDEIIAAGTPEAVIDQLQRFLDAGVTHPVIIPVGDTEETFRHYRETIIPALAD
jgi:5,10-methylenetetrahydromethanopterin reductase/phthiodiolone/phenolphthiodiolone dimycocerosates ketoreductase